MRICRRADIQYLLSVYAEWKVGGFLFAFIFLCVSHNLRLFFICLSGAGTDGICFGSSKGSESARNKIFAGNTLRSKSARKISRKTARRLDLVRASIPRIPLLPKTDSSGTDPSRQNGKRRRLSERSTEKNRFAANVKCPVRCILLRPFCDFGRKPPHTAGSVP